MAPSTPYAPHTPAETAAMLDAVGVPDEEALFDVPPEIRFDGSFDIDAKTEREARRAVASTLAENDDCASFLGRGHYDHYVPSVVSHLADRGEFLTSYTQYQPEISQGFLQALFEYQSLLVELTGLEVANCSMYDAATALGEAARLADRVRAVEGSRVLVPETLLPERRSVLRNYLVGLDLTVDSYPTREGTVDTDALADELDEDAALVYAETPAAGGEIEPALEHIGSLADEHGALFCLGTDAVALSLLQRPADVGADIVVGDATLGLPAAYGMGLGLFACREEYLRQVPGRLVGASEDDEGSRAYTLTLQTREQHIRRERATSNICTNQAWLALRAAIHASYLGADGLMELAEQMVELPRELAAELDGIEGVSAPVADRHHFREFRVQTARPAADVRDALDARGVAVHAVSEHEIQVCVTETNVERTDELVAKLAEVA